MQSFYFSILLRGTRLLQSLDYRVTKGTTEGSSGR